MLLSVTQMLGTRLRVRLAYIAYHNFKLQTHLNVVNVVRQSLSIIAQVPLDPRFSLSVLLIFGTVCHLAIRIFHRYLGSSIALTRWIFLTI